MALPVIESFASSDSGGSTTSALDFNMPSGTVAGSWLLIIAGNDDTGSMNFTATGYTGIQAGGGVSDSQIAFLYGVVTAQNLSNGYITVSMDGGNNEMWGAVLRITGIDETDPVNGSWSGEYAGSVETIGSDELFQIYAPIPTGGKVDCLLIGALAFDGADVGLWRKYLGANASWIFGANHKSGTTGNDASGCWMWTDYDTHGENYSRVTNSSNEVDGNINLGITLNAVQGLNYQETDADSAGTTPTTTFVTEVRGYALTDANAAGTTPITNFDMGATISGVVVSAGQATVDGNGSLLYSLGWTMDANHITMDNNDGNHTMDGYHWDAAQARTLIYNPIRRFLHTIVR
jgi:hypothetical protein